MSLFRSWMFVPGNHQRRLEKVKELTADVVIYDLEDAVALQEKENARKMVRDALKEYKDRCNVVRVNDMSTPFFPDDLQEVVVPGLNGIMLPKAVNAEQIKTADAIITKLEQKNGLPARSVEIVPLIESAKGLHHAFAIARSSVRVRRLAFGSVDYTLDVSATLSKEGTEILFARSQLVYLSRAADIEPPIDGVFIHIKDREGLARDAQLARKLGFQGKMVIHPDQIGTVNEVFAPTVAEIDEARQIVAAYDKAVAAGSAAIQFNGKMIDVPVAARARKTLEKARLLGKL